MKKYFILFYCLLVFMACKDNSNNENSNSAAAIPAPSNLNYTVVGIYPHDVSSFTEGLLLHNGWIWESTGNYGQSHLIKYKLGENKAAQKISLGKEYFGEGISILNNKIYQLTYKEHKVFVYDLNLKKLPQEFEWPYEGWGMTTDGKYLIIDTGGSNLYFVNPETFKIERTLGVVNNNGYVSSINELEYVDGSIYANIWMTNDIIKINAQTGLVEARANLTDILKKNNQSEENVDVLNGIAYHPEKKTFYVTGKNWPAIFEIRFN